MFKIDKDIKPPSSSRCKYPWSEMKVGDSFDFSPKSRHVVASAAAGWALRNHPERKFQTSKTRIWRVK